MREIALFSDGSVNPQLKVGFGAYLLVDDFSLDLPSYRSKIKLKKFENCSSTTLEISTLLWALSDIDLLNQYLTIYTDCQNLLGLKSRCETFEKNGYLTKSNRLIGNHELYKAFYRQIKNVNCEWVKVKGHKKSAMKDEIDMLFSFVDKASRNALRQTLIVKK
ncbi:MAG: RNase H family protein [Candidatus Marinarcus sp.]|uniref:RNase H family protein n=1 Tax=Candidatus Marinarcus sp. TaxID=3100987 RepID=UPI003B000F8B